MSHLKKRFTFKSKERLKSKKQIDRLFTEGKSFFIYPFKVFYYIEDRQEDYPVKILFSVPKKRFKRANKRNLIRRRVKEIYRLKKPDFYLKLPKNKQIYIAIIYSTQSILKSKEMEPAFKKVLLQLVEKVNIL